MVDIIQPATPYRNSELRGMHGVSMSIAVSTLG